MLNPRTKFPIAWESTVSEKLPATLKSTWEARSAEFRKRRDDLAQLVREGEMTLKAARGRAAELAEEIAADLRKISSKEKSKKPALSRMLDETQRVRSKPLTPEEAQKKTAELLMHNLTELRIANRKEEFEARTFVKSAANSIPAPSIERLFGFLQDSVETGDDAAVEWCRRQLERLRDFAADDSVRDRIDLACDRPRVLNRRLVRRYLDAIGPRIQEKGFLDTLLAKAVEQEDANACAAIFEIARKEPDSIRTEALERLAAVIDMMPDQAIRFAVRTDREAAAEELGRIDRFVETSLAWVEHEARLDDVRPPSEAELKRMERLAELPPQSPEEPIGLVAYCRSTMPGQAATSKALDSDSPGVVIS